MAMKVQTLLSAKPVKTFAQEKDEGVYKTKPMICIFDLSKPTYDTNRDFVLGKLRDCHPAFRGLPVFCFYGIQKKIPWRMVDNISLLQKKRNIELNPEECDARNDAIEY